MTAEWVEGAMGRVVLSSLTALERGPDTGTGWLTADERMRLAGIGAPLRKRQFVAGHRLARDAAAGVLDIAASRVGLDRDARGVPRLLVDGAPSAWHVSLTHSDELIACAIAPAPVGIDLEVPRRARDLAALARFTFAPEECERLEAAGAHGRVAEFYRLWALKEAAGKRDGDGVLPRTARRVVAMACPFAEADAITWTLGDVTLAVATAGADRLPAEGVPDDAHRAGWRFVTSREAG